MVYITIDGDDVGEKITAAYLSNNISELENINNLVNEKTNLIASHLSCKNFIILFCAADGVACYCDKKDVDDDALFKEIQEIAGECLTFSVGIGESLREAYIALLFAKSHGKNCKCAYKDISECSG